MTFVFHDLEPFKTLVSAIKRPVEVADFSFDDKHVCHPFSTDSLRYYYPPFFDAPLIPPSPGLNLSDGFKRFISHDDSIDLHLDAFLQTLELYEKRKNAKVDVDFITWRGMMTKIMTAPYDEGEFSMKATRFQNTIYIEGEHPSPSANTDTRPTNPHRPSLEIMQYWGYKFETLATIPRPWNECTRDEIEQRPLDVVNNNAQYCSIVQTMIGGHTMLIAGEVDAVDGCKPDNTVDRVPYVELKTSRYFQPGDQRSAAIFDQKLCRFWAQSFLLGVPKIVVGFRTRDGELVRLMELDTIGIPSRVKKGSAAWDGNVCINFASAFLTLLKQEVTGEGTWLIHRAQGAPVITVNKASDEYPPGLLYAPFKKYREELAK